jgi:hypothetical protein
MKPALTKCTGLLEKLVSDNHGCQPKIRLLVEEVSMKAKQPPTPEASSK